MNHIYMLIKESVSKNNKPDNSQHHIDAKYALMTAKIEFKLMGRYDLVEHIEKIQAEINE